MQRDTELRRECPAIGRVHLMAKKVVGGSERALVEWRSSEEIAAVCIQIVLVARRNAARKIESISYSGIT
jgi:hypothetical protein